MIRLRSQKLLSGVSTLAMLAAFGMADPVLAGQTITAAGNPNPAVTNAVNDDFIDIQAGAVVQADGQFLSVFNSGTLTSFLGVDNAVLQGGISNTGLIEGSGLFVVNNSFVDGDITNSGTIDASGVALLFEDSVLDGGITNSGLITGTSTGLQITNSTILGNIVNEGDIIGNTVGLGIDGSTVQGAVTNEGSIEGNAALFINDTVITGGVQNTGTSSSIIGTSAGILIDGATTILGGLTNEGLISGSSFVAYGIRANGGGVNIIGDLTNTGTVSASGFSAAAISLDVNTLVGSIINEGLIEATGLSAAGLFLEGGNFIGNIDNSGIITASGAAAFGVQMNGGAFIGNVVNTGTITGTDGGILLSGADFTGTILNEAGGLITTTSTSGVALQVSAGAFTGDIVNSGQILADVTSGRAIVVDGTAAFAGNITNNAGGLIRASATAIEISNGTFTGTITNEGSIVSPSGDGILIAPTVAFVGNVINNGVINGGSPAGGTGIEINTVTFTGDVVNSGFIDATSNGIAATATTFTGDISNTSTILAGLTGIYVDVTTFSGNVTNDGTITTTSSDGINVAATTFTGNVVNNQTINSGSDGMTVDVTTMTGDVVNNGLIVSGSYGMLIGGTTLTGTIINDGSIDAQGFGIYWSGTSATGGIATSGDVISQSTAIYIASAGGAVEITHTGGTIQGASAALDMNNGNDDVFNGSGGVVDGDIVVDAGDIFNTSGTWAWLRGATTGTMDEFNQTGGTVVLGAPDSATDGDGVTLDATTMNLTGGGLLHIDDDTVVNVGDLTVASANTLQFHLSYPGAVESNGQIIVSGTADITDSTLAAFIDPTTLATAAIPTTATLFFNDLIDAGTLTGTFSNVGDLVVSSNPFFEGTIVYDGDTVDIELRRLAFNDVLIASTQNQLAVGGALEEIYDNVVISAEFLDALAAVFAPGSLADVQARLDELSGHQHAQIQQGVVSLTGMLNGLVEERLDGVWLTQDGGRMNAALAGRQYAQAVAVAASDASAAAGGSGSQGLNRGASGTSIWLRGFGQFAHVDGDLEAQGYDGDSYGAVGGVDFAINNNATVGGAVAYAQTDVDFDAPADSAEVDTWQVNVYGSYGFGRFYADGQASYGWHDVAAVRLIDLPAPAGSVLATSSYDAAAWSASGEMGAIFRLGRVNMQPSLGLAYVGADVDGFVESGPAWALAVSSSDADSLASTLALRASGQWTMGQTRVVPDLKLGWRHEFGDDRQSFTANFIEDLSSGAAMSIVSSEIKADSLVVSTGATFGVTRNFEVFFDVNGQYNADASATNASGGLRFTW